MTNLLRYLGVAVTAVLVTTLLATAGAVPAFAQSTGVLALIEQLQSTVQTIQTGVNALIASDEANFRATPAVLLVEGTLRCTVVNVSNEPRTILNQVIDADTGQVVRERTGVFPPRRVDFIPVPDSLFSLRGYCMFTVLDGTRKDIRGALELVGAPPVQLAAD